MAKRSGLSQAAVSRTRRASGSSSPPHRVEAFKLSGSDPAFVDEVRDVVGLSLDPPDRALAPCVAERPPVRALARTAPVPPMRPAQPERHRAR